MKIRRFVAVAVLLLIAAAVVWAGTTLTQSTASSTASVSTVNLTFSGNVANGDLIIACDNWGNSVGTHAITDNKSGGSNTYTVFANQVKTVGNLGFNDLYCAWAIHAGSAAALQETITITGGGTHTLRLAIFDYASTTGWPASPVDQSNSNSNSGSVAILDPGNITPTVTGTLIFSAIQFTGVVSNIHISAGSCGMQEAGGTSGNGWASNGRADGADVQGATTSAQACSYAWTTNFGASALIENFKPNVGGVVSIRHRAVQN